MRLRLLAPVVACTVLMSPCSPPLAAQNVVIRLNPSLRYQTMVGWEATAQAGQTDSPAFPLYKDQLFDLAVNDLGINRLRVEIVRKAGSGGSQTGNGFDLSAFDNDMNKVALPLKQRLEARGEKLWINVCVVGGGYAADPSGYASATLELYQHMQSTFGFLPDSWEVALEPDNFGWSDTQLKNALLAAGDILGANGFSVPPFVVPSGKGVNTSLYYFNSLWNEADPTKQAKIHQYTRELSYHRYGGTLSDIQQVGDLGTQNNLRTAMLEKIGATYNELVDDLRLGNVSTWQQYTLAYPTTDDGAQYYTIDDSNPNSPVVNMGSRTKYLRQYFKYIRQGAVRIGATSTDANFTPVAFINRDGKYVVVIRASSSGAFTVQGLPAGLYGIKYTTDSQYDTNLANVTLGDVQPLSLSIPAAGVLTVYWVNGVSLPPLKYTWLPLILR